jgi:Transglutaminase-like superfamily
MQISAPSVSDTSNIRNLRARTASEKLDDWLLVVAGAISVGLLGAVVGASRDQADDATLAVLATAGYLLGFALARAAMPDLLAHVTASLWGVAASLIALEPRGLAHSIGRGDWRAIYDRYSDRVQSFIDSVDRGDRFREDVALFAVGLTIWLVGYSAAWMLYGRGWLVWSISLPAAILLVSLALNRDQPAWPGLVYLGLSLAIVAEYVASSRSLLWRRLGWTHPRGFGRRSAIIGMVIALGAVALGVAVPLRVDGRVWNQASQRSEDVAAWLQDQADRLPSDSGPSPTSGNYGSFGDQFRIGDGVPSSDSAVAILQANGPRYLAALRYDTYDTRGWRSTAGPTEHSSREPSRILYEASQPINVPPEDLSHRVRDSGSITLSKPAGQLLFTFETHLSASSPTQVRVGWQPIDETYKLESTDLDSVPIDLKPLVLTLKNAEFAPEDDENGEPVPTDPLVASQIADIREYLVKTYPIEVHLARSETGQIELRLKGRIPVHGDVEAVFASGERQGPTYRVTGLAPAVTPEELKEAPTDYSPYISNRYLQLPEMVTDRTRALSQQVIENAGAETVFDQAKAIEKYLRTNYTYQLETEPAPEDEDAVDYFLFESQIGRCDHFASSMVVMLRALGIPSRIVTGLAPVPIDEDAGGYLYRVRDAHSWVEVYFPGFGWIPFEPTPSQSEIDLNSTTGDPDLNQPIQDVQTPIPEPTAIADQPTPEATPELVGASTSDNEGSSGMSTKNLSLFGAAALIVAVLVGSSLAIAVWTIRLRGLDPGAAYFTRLLRAGRFWGVRSSPTQTPREFAAAYGRVSPRSALASQAVADAFTREQYGGSENAGGVEAAAAAGWRAVKRGMTSWRPWRRGQGS